MKPGVTCHKLVSLKKLVLWLRKTHLFIKKQDEKPIFTTTKIFPWWFHIYRDWDNSSKGHVTRKAHKYTSRVQIPSGLYLWHPKTRKLNFRKSGVIYKYKCSQISCLEEYIGETGRALGDRLKEHLRVPSPIHQWTCSTGHPISSECFSIVHREAQGTIRNIKDAMFIRANEPSLNSNIAKYQLPHVWDQILYSTPALKLK